MNKFSPLKAFLLLLLDDWKNTRISVKDESLIEKEDTSVMKTTKPWTRKTRNLLETLSTNLGGVCRKCHSTKIIEGEP